MATSALNHWRTNWPKTHGFVCPEIFYPRSLSDISVAIKSTFNVDEPQLNRQMKAIGGGWSFSDAALPFTAQVDVDRFSIQLVGEFQTRDLSKIFRILGGDTTPQLIDTTPPTVDGEVQSLTHYDQTATSQLTANSATTPFFENAGAVTLINIENLASSLQQTFPAILSVSARTAIAGGKNFFHVEAGITIADLQQLLDHQSPRLALRSTGGSPGATLAGTLSTATHGGEFTFPLLTDTVRAVHLVGPTGEQWWIEGNVSIADQAALQATYPQLDAAHFIGGSWAGIPGLTPQDVLNAVIVSMGTMGVIYSVVLDVAPQFGLQQRIVHLPGTSPSTGWDALLMATGDSNIKQKLRSLDPTANMTVLGVLLDGTQNGTGIPLAQNVYADLAINPFNLECWVTNRQVTPDVPLDSNNPSASIGDYVSSLSTSLTLNPKDGVWGINPAPVVARIFDFFDWDKDSVAFFLNGDQNFVEQLVSFVTNFAQFSSVFAPVLALVNKQAVLNENSKSLNAFDRDNRGSLFLSACLSGFLNAIQGTAGRTVSDRTDLSYKVGAIGWPDGGIPGRGLEIAMDSQKAFSFLQKDLFDDILPNIMIGKVKPLIGYISVRICPPTTTLFGMQQFAPFSAMIEIVGYRSPESDFLMDQIQERVLATNTGSPGSAMLHWGLENDQMQATDLARTPLSGPLHPMISKIEAFKSVRAFFLKHNTFNPFDNNLTRRLGL
jgi:hypothetical protein